MDKKCIDVRRFILTGTPGSGKTSVIKELEKLGHIVIHEAATDVILREQDAGIENPWEASGFVDKIVCMQKERQMNASGDLQFYDRSPFCTYALAKHFSHAITPVLLSEIDNCLKNIIYQNDIFFFENLGITEYTDARKISHEEALICERVHLDVHNQFGFNIVIVPKGLTITQRCKFILERVK